MTAPTPASATRSGILYAAAAYLAWGLSPIYWKLLAGVGAVEILAHRIVWSALLLAVWMAALRRGGEVRAAFRSPRVLATLAATTVLIAVNWGTYIWAVNASRLVEASLGYYVNPLVTVLLALVVLGERLSRARWAALALAGAGVVTLAVEVGRPPWVALVLAFSFAFYSLLRKTVRAEPETGLFVETLLLAPLAAGYLGWLEAAGRGALGHTGTGTFLLLAGAGVVTTVPLVWFTRGARRLPLATVGFLQYLSPTMQFLLGVFVYREPFDSGKLMAFLVIWAALVLFTWDTWRQARVTSDRPPHP